MGKSNLSTFVKNTQRTLSKHSPEILTGIGIAGMVTTAVLAVKATPKALTLLKNKRTELNLQYDEHLTVGETVKTCWKCYIPAVVTGTASIACLIGASSVNAKRYAALTTAYKISETAFHEYRDKVVETIGEKKEKTVREHISQDKLDKTPVKQTEVIITGNGDTLCYDYYCGRHFKSNMETLKKVENELNRRMRSEMYVSLNEFYYEIGLEGVHVGDYVGWNIDRGYIDLTFTSQLASDGTPCLVVAFGTPPRYDFRD